MHSYERERESNWREMGKMERQRDRKRDVLIKHVIVV